MGSKAINLIPGDATTYAQSGDTLRTELELGIMEQLNKQLEPLKKKAETVMVSLDTVLVALQEIFSEDANGNIRGSLKSVSRTLDNVEHASGTLNDLLANESSRISKILENINSITGNLENSNANITRSLDNITGISDSLKAVNLANTVRYLNSVLAQTDSIVMKINRFKRIADPGNIIQATGYIRITVFQVSGYAIDILENFRNPGGLVGQQIVQSTGSMLYVIQCAADTFQGSPDISIGIFTKNLLQSHQYRIQRDHCRRLGFLLQGFQLFVQLFHDTQFQFRSQGIPALGISRCISGDEVDGFRAHQDPALRIAAMVLEDICNFFPTVNCTNTLSYRSPVNCMALTCPTLYPR